MHGALVDHQRDGELQIQTKNQMRGPSLSYGPTTFIMNSNALL